MKPTETTPAPAPETTPAAAPLFAPAKPLAVAVQTGLRAGRAMERRAKIG